MAKKIKKYKVGMDSETYAISMVEMPAIEEDFVALAKHEEEKIFLSSNEKHMVYGAVLVPDRDIYRNDGEKEYYLTFSQESIEKMSQDFMKEYRQAEVTVDHEDIANEVCVVESWLKSDMYKDKSVALGLNQELPIGTWFCGMKVNNIETWDRIKAGELKGFSVESMVSLEEFSKNDNNMIETNDEMFFEKIKNAFKEVLASLSLRKQEVDVETSEAQKVIPLDEGTEIKQEVDEAKIEGVMMEEEAPTVETPNEPTPEPTETVPEPKEEDTKPQVVEEPQKPQEEPKPNPLEELVKSLTDEVKALKEMNEGLNKRVKELGKTPSAAPVNTNAKPSSKDTYSAWRETMRGYLS